MKKAKFKTVVKRSEWGRGGTGGVLLSAGGLKCCLGFRCEQAGIPAGNLLDEEMPWAIKGHSKLPHWLSTFDSNSADAAATVNDDRGLTDEEREAEIIRIFVERGEEIEFVD